VPTSDGDGAACHRNGRATGQGGRQQKVRDVLDRHVSLRMSNVIVAPHSAFNTREAVGRILDTTVENIVAFDRGEPLDTVLEPKGGPG
jgi:lactate dehydrogenase-like 2-hydroxyacid dehydrogenase